MTKSERITQLEAEDAPMKHPWPTLIADAIANIRSGFGSSMPLKAARIPQDERSTLGRLNHKLGKSTAPLKVSETEVAK